MPELIDAVYFKELSDHNQHDVCKRAACTYSDTERTYAVSAWDQKYRVYPLQYRIEAIGKPPRKLHPFFELFIIHYLLRAKEIDPANQWISEKDIPGGATFFRGPHAIPTDLISSRFDNDLQRITERCAHLNGTPLDLADAAYAFQITPRIPVAVLYWQGDDEFPPESKILFDKTISEHLATDIIFALAVGICERLGKQSN